MRIEPAQIDDLIMKPLRLVDLSIAQVLGPDPSYSKYHIHWRVDVCIHISWAFLKQIIHTNLIPSLENYSSLTQYEFHKFLYDIISL